MAAGFGLGTVGAVLAAFSCGELHTSPPTDAGTDVDSGVVDPCAYDAGFARPLACPAGNRVACASFDDQSTGEYAPQVPQGGLAYIDPPACTPDHSRGDKVVRVLPATDGTSHPYLQRDFAADGGAAPGPADIALRFVMRIDGEVPSTPVEVAVLHDESASTNYVSLYVSKTQLQAQSKSAPSLAAQTFAFEAGRWYCIELDATFQAAGKLRVSVDDQPLITDTAIDLGGDAGFATGPRYIDVGVVAPYSGTAFTLYLDDVASAVGTTAIGCR